jgi:DNA modification methylase
MRRSPAQKTFTENTRSYRQYRAMTRFFFQAAYNLEHADPVRYVPKASRKERDAGLDGEFPEGEPPRSGRSKPAPGRKRALGRPRRNAHPTVKPIALAKWLATLLLPPPEYAPRRLLIPFAGSGSEAIGAGLAGWDEMTLIEMDADTCAIAEARLEHWLNEPRQLGLMK